ncbi:MAG TPA: ECF-type sigma factor [Gemmatimonadaceae bacterium]|jgi:RNA polymerase sigma factor (TIGR02999 family)
MQSQPLSDLIRAADSLQGEGAQPAEALFAALYDELHRVAERQLHRNGGNVPLSTTTLVHEAYLDICGRSGTQFPDKARFIGYASRAMRGIVIDYMRYSRAAKRGGGAFEITLTGNLDAPVVANATEDLEKLSEALDSLAKVDPALSQLVDLHFFCGYELREIAEMRGVSERTVQRDWRKARLLLRHHMLDETPTAEGENG